MRNFRVQLPVILANIVNSSHLENPRFKQPGFQKISAENAWKRLTLFVFDTDLTNEKDTFVDFEKYDYLKRWKDFLGLIGDITEEDIYFDVRFREAIQHAAISKGADARQLTAKINWAYCNSIEMHFGEPERLKDSNVASGQYFLLTEGGSKKILADVTNNNGKKGLLSHGTSIMDISKLGTEIHETILKAAEIYTETHFKKVGLPKGQFFADQFKTDKNGLSIGFLPFNLKTHLIGHVLNFYYAHQSKHEESMDPMSLVFGNMKGVVCNYWGFVLSTKEIISPMVLNRLIEIFGSEIGKLCQVITANSMYKLYVDTGGDAKSAEGFLKSLEEI